ncbi:MAG: TrkA family potassium uptake protein [Clostridiaceae bacterium]|jgi:trk system potassium uptake protein TrkA|nr:TrkA family potassium uptake protein [Clostridiaceae bacterium]
MQIIVVGCGKVGASLAGVLVDQGHDVVIVESDSQLIRSASDLDCIKINGVPIDRDVLRQAGIETADVVCAVTQNDNINIMVAQIAGHVFSVPRVITRIFNPGSRPVFESFGLEAICSTELTVQAFLRSIHREQEIKQERLFSRTVHYSRVPISPEVVGEPVANLATEAGRLIFGVLRAGELLLADPGLKVEAGDELVLAELH